MEALREDVDAVLDPILSRQTFKSGGVLSIKIGENVIDYAKKFRIYLCSKASNPHFSPELSTRVNIVNFSITREGLED